ncbi:hypothetical protein ACEPAG_5549 [Sanghuangporus baumii]
MSAASSFLRTGKKIIAIGRNYVLHVKELNNTVPKEPFFFLKPTTSYLPSGGKIEIPRGVLAHHEIELGVIVGKSGRDINASQADSYIAGYALAIDMTARNMQEDVKKRGLPWSASKGFDTFTPIGSFIDRSAVPDPSKLNFWIKINGTIKQKGTPAEMIFPISKLIEHVSSIMTLEEGDLILTGTPSGVGPVSVGDEITAELSTESGAVLSSIQFTAIQRDSGYQFKPE